MSPGISTADIARLTIAIDIEAAVFIGMAFVVVAQSFIQLAIVEPEFIAWGMLEVFEAISVDVESKPSPDPAMSRSLGRH